MSPVTRHIAVVFALVSLAAGCANANNTQKGAAIGAVGGSALGAIVGHQFGKTGAGALVGGLAGTAVGALAGNAEDESEKREKLAKQVAYERRAREQRDYAMTNRDVVQMVSSGCSDRLICDTIRDRGGNFDMSPHAVVQLHQMGVEDNIISAMRRNNLNR